METDREYQTRWLEQIIDEGLNAPVFKSNPDFPTPHGDGVPRINYNDVMARRLIIRICPIEEVPEPFWIGETEIIGEYADVAALVADGWRLD